MHRIDYENQIIEYEEWIADNYPEHDRTSCSDADLYNCGSVMLRHRCERCESLNQLEAWKRKHMPATDEHKALARTTKR